MTDAPLHPIVIAAVVSGPFECLGNGLLHDGVEREQPNTLKDLLVPTKSSKRTPIEDRERPKKWWKAQCFHYGIHVPASATISTYRVHLENAIRQRGGLKRPQELTDLESEQNAKFKDLNAKVWEATNGGSQAKPSKDKTKTAKPTQVAMPESEPAPSKAKTKTTAEPKAKEPKVKTEPKAKAEPKSKVERKEPKTKTGGSAAEPAPKATTAKKQKAETVVHVYHYDGDKATQVALTPTVELETVKRPAKKARAAAPPVPASMPSQAQASTSDAPPSYSEVAPRPKQTARRNRFFRHNGLYELTCSSEDEWPSPGNCRPTLIIEISDSGEPWFTGLLKLPGLMVCVLRIKTGLDRPDDGYVRFEWCGREEGTGQILTPGPYKVGWLKVNVEQSHVKGMIQGYCGEFHFSGSRVNATPAYFFDYEWDDFGMDAYEEANRQRWR